MSDKPEEQQQGARKHQPSFEEVLQGVQVEEPIPVVSGVPARAYEKIPISPIPPKSPPAIEIEKVIVQRQNRERGSARSFDDRAVSSGGVQDGSDRCFQVS